MAMSSSNEGKENYLRVILGAAVPNRNSFGNGLRALNVVAVALALGEDMEPTAGQACERCGVDHDTPGVRIGPPTSQRVPLANRAGRRLRVPTGQPPLSHRSIISRSTFSAAR